VSRGEVRFQNFCAVLGITHEVVGECINQMDKHGVEDLPNGTGGYFGGKAAIYRGYTEEAVRLRSLTWRHILLEEVYEALAEEDPERLRTELLQVAAVCASWIASIDRTTPQSSGSN
jgi:hypothetical protein